VVLLERGKSSTAADATVADVATATATANATAVQRSNNSWKLALVSSYGLHDFGGGCLNDHGEQLGVLAVNDGRLTLDE
jgi:hypothetical protein